MKIKFLSIALALLLLPFSLFSCGEDKSDVRLGNIMILGDSYSTFEGWIPEGYVSWYYPEAEYTNVKRAEETWWSILAKRCNSEILLNCSYSGTTVCHTGYGGDCSSTSFLTRFNTLVSQGFFENNRVDTLIILGGLNDLWSGAPIGEIMLDGVSEADAYSFLPAVFELLSTAKKTLPKAKIIFLVEQDLSDEMKQGIDEICSALEIPTVKLLGVTKHNAHPDKNGMESIATQIIDFLEE